MKVNEIKKQNFVKGALVLIVGGILVKIIGALFKIPLGNILGEKGMGYFTTAYDIYTWMYILATSGLPIAVSRLVAETNAKNQYNETDKIIRVVLPMFAFIGIVGTAILLFFSESLSEFFELPESRIAIIAIAPSILFETIMACYIGYYQGHQNMNKTAISQLIVAMSKLVIGLALSLYLLNAGYSIEWAVAGAIFGVTFGTLLSTIFLAISKRKYKKRKQAIVNTKTSSTKSIIKKVLSISIPITIGASVLSITNLIDLSLLMKRLIAAGLSYDYAQSVFGSYRGFATVLFNLPTALIMPMTASLIPILTEKYSQKNLSEAKKVTGSALRISTLLSLPAALGLVAMSYPILALLYPAQMDAVEISAPLLSMLGPSVVFVSLAMITTGILQAIGKEKIPVITMLIGGAVKLLSNYYLVSNPKLNINGAPIGTALCYFTICLLNFIIIAKYTKLLPNLFSVFTKPFISAAFCAGTAYALYGFIFRAAGGFASTVISLFLGAVVYLIFLLFLRALRRDDLNMLPFGEKLTKILEKGNFLL